ncbi:MAG: SAM-dependent methyltransferase [Myxococcales bacterium]|nr:SAM-dependent methyltransferase [Myxococcales bacterium]
MTQARKVTGTALGTMALAAVETNFPPGQSLTRDELAASVLPPSWSLLVHVTRVPWLREAILRRLDRSHPGTWAGIACRKAYLDERLGAALEADVGAVVSLGAGLDTRAHRLPGRERVPWLEVDLPENIARKRAWIERRFGAVPSHVTLVAIDFDHDDLGRTLAAHGLPTDAPIFFLWEGVTQYLQEAGVRATLEALRFAPTGSLLAFSYVRRDFIDGTQTYGLDALRRRLVVQQHIWHFGLLVDEVDPFLRPYGWRVQEHLGSAELEARYVAPTGRAMTVMPIERLVLAEKI